MTKKKNLKIERHNMLSLLALAAIIYSLIYIYEVNIMSQYKQAEILSAEMTLTK